MRSMMSSSSAGLTPAAGSSSRISCGSAISTRASSSSLRWPPESTRAGSCGERRQRDEVEQARAPCRRPPAPAPRPAPGRRKFGQDALAGLVLRAGHHVFEHRHLRRRGAGSGRCGPGPARCAAPAARASRRAPSSRIWPAVGLQAAGEQLNSVVLPAPLGPMRPERSRRAAASSDMPSTARMPPNCMTRSARRRRHRHVGWPPWPCCGIRLLLRLADV